MVSIDAKVGDWNKGAVNRPDDVITVQELLTAAAIKLKRPDYDPGGIDGKIAPSSMSSSTAKAIRAFQKRFMSSPDGIVSPGKKTITELAAFESVLLSGLDPASILGKLGAAYQSWVNSLGGGGSGGSAGMTGPCFPLAKVPGLGYHKGSGARWFGASRKVKEKGVFKGYRKHAACDLIAREGTPIYAVDDGEVVRGPYGFYRGTYAIEVKHPSFLVRYCEIKKAEKSVKHGKTVSKGQVIAYVGKMWHDSMLHLEMYSGKASGNLTDRSQKLGKTIKEAPFQRRTDLLDPTAYLDSWKGNMPGP